MAKKFFGILSLVICIVLSGACFSACKKAVTVQGTINIVFDGFTQDDISGNMYFSFSGPGYKTSSSTQTGITATFGPEKTKNKDNFVVDISLNSIYAPNIAVTENNNKTFTTSKRATDINDQHFFITIPFAETIDYTLTISKPDPRLYQVDLDLLSATAITSTDPKVQDILDHSQIWVENKDTNPANGQLVSGFVPIVRDQSGTRKFNLAGKYINADMTQETFTMYLKYDNDDRAIPYLKGTLENAFGCSNGRYPTMRTAELDGQKVYAFDYQTQYIDGSSSIKMSFDELEYISAQVSDNSGRVIAGTSDGISYSSLDLYFERVGWKSGANGEWQSGGNPQKTYGEPLSIKYKLSEIDAGGHEDVFKEILDFQNIKFQINGKSVPTIFETTNEDEDQILTFTIVLGEFDTPETYLGEYSTTFEIGVDSDTIKEQANLEGVKEVVYSNELVFYQGDDNLLLSDRNADGNAKHARVYTRLGANELYDPFEFKIKNIGMFDRFTITITLGEKTYTKEFVLGTDFLVRGSGEGQLANAYVFDTKYGSETYPILPTDGDDDGLVYYYMWVDGRTTELYVRANYEQVETVEARISNITYRTIEFEANGDAYAGELDVQGTAPGRDRTESVDVYFDLNKVYDPDTPNINVRAAIYSGDVLICYINNGSELVSQIGDFIYDNSFSFYASSYGGSVSETVLEFSTNGRISIKEQENDPYINILITKIVITFNSAN